MRKKYSSIIELLENELSLEEEITTSKLMLELSKVKDRGYFDKEQFIEMGMWKSPRFKKQYQKNSEETIDLVSKKVFSTRYEKRKIELLTSLNGVSLPTASAILALIDPQNYGVIDIRVWRILYLYGSVKVKPKGTNFNFKNWFNYKMKFRYYAKKFNVSARDIERILILHHKKVQEGNLYK